MLLAQPRTGQCAWCRVQFQYLQLAAWSPVLVSCLSICRDYYIGTILVLTLTLVPRHSGIMHNALNYSFFICAKGCGNKACIIVPCKGSNCWAVSPGQGQGQVAQCAVFPSSVSVLPLL